MHTCHMSLGTHNAISAMPLQLAWGLWNDKVAREKLQKEGLQLALSHQVRLAL